MISGIYQIRNLVNNKLYIGSATVLSTRKGSHFSLLRSGKHDNSKLQRAWNKYGGNNFSFEILFTCEPETLLVHEQKMIDELKPEYNICQIAGNTFGRRMSEEAKQKMSLAKKGRPANSNQLKILKNGRRPGGWNAGSPLPDWWRKKISESMKGKKNTLGHTLSRDHRNKISKSLIGNKRGTGRPHDALGRFCSPNKSQTSSSVPENVVQ